MQSLILAALPRAGVARGSTNAIITAAPALKSWATKRAFSSLPGLRPTILAPSHTHGGVFRSPNSSNLLLTSFAPTPTSGGCTLDLVPKTAITAHPALGQIRCGPRPTMARSSRLVRKRRHGFLSRIRSHKGRRTLQRRRDKKRSILSN
ncbi:uncharacterized protein GGS25DRAFT_491135 [Hypoxylon fragiforme]|uniref:uncharacterized protein n=1 Tax=Hypoxylon fragiforme TaxID=63214 RepID=UPI0020C6740D|nr:uncharacterized protein GGS25DRAFT_491135 [Hypoxylon fragiforme]KAI2608653.1 hypothetical protein GGS25DRAFT_491135 [Hypoxylon fragiforme]